MYIDVEDNIAEMQDGPSLEIDGPPRIAKNLHFGTLWPIYEKLVVNCCLCCTYVCSVSRS